MMNAFLREDRSTSIVNSFRPSPLLNALWDHKIRCEKKILEKLPPQITPNRTQKWMCNQFTITNPHAIVPALGASKSFNTCSVEWLCPQLRSVNAIPLMAAVHESQFTVDGLACVPFDAYVIKDSALLVRPLNSIEYGKLRNMEKQYRCHIYRAKNFILLFTLLCTFRCNVCSMPF